MTRSSLVAAACLLTLAVAACGRYGPPVRAPRPAPATAPAPAPDPAANDSQDEPPAP